jgi:hypothetical protein
MENGINPSVTYEKSLDALMTQIKSGIGRVQLGDDPARLDKINDFLRTYPKIRARDDAASSRQSSVPWVDISVRQVFINSIQTAIDIINDISKLVSEQPFISSADYRRGLFEAFARPERRTYVGLWLIFLSFVLYFIDSTA